MAKLALFSALVLASAAAVDAHSAMFCVKWNKATKTCEGYPRFFDARREIGDGYMGNKAGDNPCAVANRIGFSTRYALYNDAFPMATAKAGEAITLMWPARNHAVTNQNPANNIISIAKTPYAGALPDKDILAGDMQEIGQVPFMSEGATGCEGGNGDGNICTGTVTLPANLKAGVYQVVWDWKGLYSTCGDIMITSAGGQPANPPPAAAPSSPAPSLAAPSASATTSPATNNGNNGNNGGGNTQPSISASPSALPPVPSGVLAQVSFAVAWRGGNGWGAQVTVSSSKACPTWEVSFDLAAGLTFSQAWNAQGSSSGQTVTFKSMSYNGLNAGDRRAFGFNGGRVSATTDTPIPTSFKFVCDGVEAKVGSATAPLQILTNENGDLPSQPYGEFARLAGGSSDARALIPFSAAVVTAAFGAAAFL